MPASRGYASRSVRAHQHEARCVNGIAAGGERWSLRLVRPNSYAALRLARNSPMRSSALRMFSVELA